MGTRGPQSVAALSVVPHVGIEEIRRPQPPSELSDEQKQEWLAVVNRLPADWFPRETHGMLVQYCRHTIAAKRVAQLIERIEQADADEINIGDYDRLLKMQEREGRAISSLATRMRLSQQATVRAESAKKPSQLRKPWQM